MLDRTAFFRPIAHRGLHCPYKGIVENTAPAFSAAMAKGYGIECDLSAAADGLPVVFHDDTLDRLTEGSGPIGSLTQAALKLQRHKLSGSAIITYGELLEMTAGKVPLLVEVKSNWQPPNPKFLRQIADLSWRYKGPLALMSFDPAIVAALGALSPGVPRGIVSGPYHDDDAEDGWGNVLDADRKERLANLLESRGAAPDFYAYDVRALPTPVTRFVREVQGLPLFTWTVRSDDDRARATKWADAPIFEGFEP